MIVFQKKTVQEYLVVIKINKKNVITTFALLFYFFSTPTSYAQDPIILISDVRIQIEITDAMNNLYNFKFETAEQQFRWVKQKYPWHPLSYFLLGLSSWWRIVPNVQNTAYDDRFIAYMDSAIWIAKRLCKKKPAYEIEAAFFQAAAYGFKARLYSDETRKNWGKALASGKPALHYLEKSKEEKSLSPELLFGDALYNYFSAWIPDNYPTLKPLLWFFPKGDKELGLKQLKEVSYNAFYTRTEAMIWLMKIFFLYENKREEALQLANYLHQVYPDNPYIHYYYSRILYANSLFEKLHKESTEILHRIDSGMVGYGATSGRYAAFFLAQLSSMKGNSEEAKKYYLLTVHYASSIGAMGSGYSLASLMILGDMYLKEEDREKAVEYFTKAKKESDRKSATFKEAKKKLKTLNKKNWRNR